MSEMALRVDGVDKRYRVGAARRRYPTLREAAASRARALVRGRTRDGARADDVIWALRDVSFDVRAGEAVGVIGGNGAGKSTLLRILSRITEPTAGSATIRGRVGSLLEVGTGFHLELTGRENVYLNGAILGMRRREIDRRFDEIVEFADVARFLDTPVKHYSSGMYLRLAFAVASHLDPEILLVDEVLAVGDAAFQRKCLGRMRDVTGRGRTVLFVSHNMDAVQRLCPRTLLLRRGQVAADGDSASVVSAYLAMTGERPGAADWIDLALAEREGSGRSRFAAAQYRAGDGGETPHSSGPLELTLVVDSDADRTVESLAVTIATRTGLLLLNADSVMHGTSVRLRRGRTEIRLRFDALHLAPGVYVVGLWLARSVGEVFDRVESAFEIEVRDAEAHALGRTPSNNGVVTCRFTVDDGGGDVATEAGA